jgi:hypothetical protein
VVNIRAASNSPRTWASRMFFVMKTRRKLKTGDDPRPHEVEEMGRRLWARHLEVRKKQL